MRAIVDRGSWGADTPGDLEPLAAVAQIVVHHTATPWDSEPDAVLRIQRLHTGRRGWADIGYHLLVGPDGALFEGRSRAAAGAHVLGRNEHSLGVAMIGDFSVAAPTPEGLATLRECLAWLASEYDLPVSAQTLVGHGEVARTACPGVFLARALHDLRAAI
jgi:N-acetylmuramoyl-L-alanine amidase